MRGPLLAIPRPPGGLALAMLFLAFLFGSVVPGLAIAAEAEAQAAERAGRFADALRHYAAALRTAAPGSADERRLLERAATITPKAKPLPPLPPEAERHFVRGQAAVKAAKDAEMFGRAADEFGAALRFAPWLADAHYNRGIVLDKAGRHADAMQSLKLYILAAPNAPDAKDAQRLIYEIEFRQEEAARASSKSTAEAKARAEAEERKCPSGEFASRANRLAARLVGRNGLKAGNRV